MSMHPYHKHFQEAHESDVETLLTEQALDGAQTLEDFTTTILPSTDPPWNWPWPQGPLE